MIDQMNTETLDAHIVKPESSLETRNHWTLWLAAALILLLFAPTMLWLWGRWTISVWHNGHGIIIAVVVVYLVWVELQKQRDLPISSNPWGFAILIPALVLHMLDTSMHSQLLSAFALFLSLPGLSLLFEHFTSFHGFIGNCIGCVSGVQVPDIYIICVQRFETFIHIFEYFSLGSSIGFCGQYSFVPFPSKGGSCYPFTVAISIATCRVKVIDTQIDGSCDDLRIGLNTDSGTNSGDFQTRFA